MNNPPIKVWFRRKRVFFYRFNHRYRIIVELLRLDLSPVLNSSNSYDSESFKLELSTTSPQIIRDSLPPSPRCTTPKSSGIGQILKVCNNFSDNLQQLSLSENSPRSLCTPGRDGDALLLHLFTVICSSYNMS
ncbi:hypothetical protein DICVIV_12812 [Dictyocaulus viviparus]|uniref:Uncharacterized protein n=1 Tax=Dictyocaulus viviparus TaxID=29172 RepID=A0A0D8XFT1_DICVI|nr:hypothetical protein DICVIV_12812 [Dictyocaulus viviparus]